MTRNAKCDGYVYVTFMEIEEWKKTRARTHTHTTQNETIIFYETVSVHRMNIRGKQCSVEA